MGNRIRSRVTGSVSDGGTAQLKTRTGFTVGAPLKGYTGTSQSEYCNDVTMVPPFNVDHPLTLQKFGFKDPGRVTGFADEILSPDGPSNRYYEVKGYVPSSLGYAGIGGVSTSPINWAYWRTKALANMNPNAAALDVPLFLFEFREFPRMLKHLGDVLSRKTRARDVPEGYLAYSFGWTPLLADLMTLLKIKETINQRIAYFNRLERGTRVSRALGTRVLQRRTIPDGWSFSLGRLMMQADYEIVETHRVWFTANAKVMTKLPVGSDLRSLSVRTVFGLNVSAQTIWNAIPWSWLIDYFVNIGDFLEANRGFIPWSATRMNIMCTVQLERNIRNVRTYDAQLSLDGGKYLRIDKNRVCYTNPTARYAFDPFLTGGQMANLGALITAKALRAL